MTYYERHLPHWHPEGKDIFITWRLEGTLPASRFVRPDGLTSGKAFDWVDRYPDQAKHGPSWLRRPEIAEIVVRALHHHQNELRRFALHAYVVMPNHVHLLITPCQPLPKIMQSLKGFTAREINASLHRTGQPLWQQESYDHWLREGEFGRIKRYIELNPVRAGLVNQPSEFPWSSAYLCADGDMGNRIAQQHR